MKLRYVVTISILVLVAAFALLNWSVFMQPSTLNLLVAKVDAPFAVIMFMVLGVLAFAYLIGVARVEIRAGMEVRSLYRELERARQVAERVEESRLAELREFLRNETSLIQAKLDRLLTTHNRGEIPFPGAHRG